jgi:hypothetical protein
MSKYNVYQLDRVDTHIYVATKDGEREHVSEVECWCSPVEVESEIGPVYAHTGRPQPSVQRLLDASVDLFPGDDKHGLIGGVHHSHGVRND